MTFQETRLYAMVADPGSDIRHFKIGITSNLMKRLHSVQTGCPSSITAVMSVILPTRFQAEAAEQEMHCLLSEYNTSGEWFAFNVHDPVHKAAFNGAARRALDKQLGAGWTWTFADLAQVRGLLAETRPKAQRMVSQGVLAHAYRMAKGLPMW